MKIDKCTGDLEEKEYLYGMSIQLVFLNEFLFKSRHSDKNWVSYTFPCIKDETGKQLEWNQRYSYDCLIKQHIVGKDQIEVANILTEVLNIDQILINKPVGEGPKLKRYQKKCKAADFLQDLKKNFRSIHDQEGAQVDPIITQMFIDEPLG